MRYEESRNCIMEKILPTQDAFDTAHTSSNDEHNE